MDKVSNLTLKGRSFLPHCPVVAQRVEGGAPQALRAFPALKLRNRVYASTD